ncbi:MAG: hypothetical protein ACR2P2_08905 [Nakamurella sp.]
MDSSAAGQALLEHFRWVDGHADVWRVFRHGNAFRQVVSQLAADARELGATAIIGIESRGFLLGGAVAAELGCEYRTTPSGRQIGWCSSTTGSSSAAMPPSRPTPDPPTSASP